jgi:enoyl-[acyl-carrier protein] reductase I
VYAHQGFVSPPCRTGEGKKGLVVGIANEDSLAYGCAKAFRGFGAEFGITYLNDKAKLLVEPLANELDASSLMPLDVEREGQMEAHGASRRASHDQRWYAFYDDLLRRREGHLSLQRHGAGKLEASCRYLAAELGRKGIRVHAISPGPIQTRAASVIAEFDSLLEKAASEAPAGSLVSTADVGFATAALATYAARLINGNTMYVDGGLHVMW